MIQTEGKFAEIGLVGNKAQVFVNMSKQSQLK